MKKYHLIFEIATILLILAICSPISLREIKAKENPIDTPNMDLYSKFQNPAEDMSSKPLFFWNTPIEDMTEEKIREIVRRSYEESGYSGFGILPFWQEEYFSERYFELYEAALDEGSKYGMKFSLYDENGFPSYTAGGLFAEQYPELTAKRIDMLESSNIVDGKINLKIPRGKLMGVVAYNKETNERIDVTDRAVIVDVPSDTITESVGSFSSSAYSNEYDASKAFDDDINTRWNAAELQKDNQWIGAMFSENVTIDSVVISEAFNRISSFSIQYYDQGNWINCASGTTIGSNLKLSFNPVTTRGLRLYIHTSGTSSWETPSIYEFKMFSGNQQIFVESNTDYQYDGSYIEYPVSDNAWKLMAFVCVKDGSKGMDYLSEEAVAGFINVTYEEYYKRFKKYFDNGTITSAFYDEPSFWGQGDSLTDWGVEGGRMWTEDFNEVYAEMFGKDTNPVLNYPALWYNIGGATAEARNKMNAVRTEMFAKHYIGQLNKWCEDHGIELMGHMLYEDVNNPVPSHGDLMYCFKYQNCPTVDVISYYGMSEDYYKIISSSAYNWDHPHVGVECYGAISNMSVDVLYKNAMDLYAKGINVMVPHAVWYDEDDVYFQPELSYRTEPYATILPQYNKYIARLQTMLQEGRHIADIAMLYPIDTLEYFYSFQRTDLFMVDSNYIEIGNALSESIRMDYTYIHPSVLDEKVTVNGSTLHMDNENNYEDYKVMIMPSMSVISKSNLEKIHNFYQSGGIVISIGALPYLATEEKDNDAVRTLIEEMFGESWESAQNDYIERNNDNGGQIYHLTKISELETTLSQAYDNYDVNISAVEEKNGHLTYIHKFMNNTDIYFFANSSDIAVDTTIKLRGEFENLEVWNPMTGERTPITSATIENGATTFTLDFAPVTSLFVVAGCNHDYNDGVCSKCGEEEPEYTPPTNNDNTENDSPSNDSNKKNLIILLSSLGVLGAALASVFIVIKRKRG